MHKAMHQGYWIPIICFGYKCFPVAVDFCTLAIRAYDQS